MKEYFVITGNEYGASIPDKITFITFDEAETQYVEHILNEEMYVAMYKLNENGIEQVKSLQIKSEYYEL